MQEEHLCKKGVVVLVSFSNNKRWMVAIVGKENESLDIFEDERKARTYLKTLIEEK
ncbi:MAG: hypothetical protein NTV07_00970 [Candidatus Omnitrophica bacterium]|nr:hypothetical protein [Candidatus Omnitrophota bacterium]